MPLWQYDEGVIVLCSNFIFSKTNRKKSMLFIKLKKAGGFLSIKYVSPGFLRQERREGQRMTDKADRPCRRPVYGRSGKNSKENNEGKKSK